MKLPEWIDGPQADVGDSKGQGRLGMRMDHRLHIGTGFVDSAVNEPFKIRRSPVADRVAVEVEFQKVFAFDEFRRQRAREEESFGVVRMTDTHMAVGIDDALVGEYAIGDDELVQQIVQFVHGLSSGSQNLTSMR